MIHNTSDRKTANTCSDIKPLGLVGCTERSQPSVCIFIAVLRSCKEGLKKCLRIDLKK